MKRKKRKMYLTGSSGMLGSAIVSLAKTEHEVFAVSKSGGDSSIAADITNYPTMKEHITSFRPDIIIHAAALTNAEACEVHKDDATRVNVKATEHLSSLAQKYGIPFVYISTSGIFDGVKDWYTEEDVPHPINHYGVTKYLGEQVVQSMTRYYVFRAGWMVGGGEEKDKKIVGSLLRQIKKGAHELCITRDIVGTITYTYDFAKTILHAVQVGAYGTYHCASPDDITRVDLGNMLCQLLGVTIPITEVDRSYFRDQFFVKRPASERLSSGRIAAMGLSHMRSTKESLRDYLRLWQ